MKKIFFSSACINIEDIEYSLSELIKIGIQNIELSGETNYIFDIENVLERFKKEYNLNFLLHNYFPPPEDSFVLNLASQNQIIWNRSIAHCKKAIKLADKLKAPTYSVHSGIRLDPDPSELGKPIKQSNIVSYEDAYNTLVQSLVDLCDYAGYFNVNIALENHVLTPFNLTQGKNELLLMCESQEFLQLFKDVRKANLRVLVDLGHLKVTSNTLGFDRIDFINEIKDKISLFHLSENNGEEDQHEMINENCWFWELFGNFQDAFCVIESHNLTLEQIKLSEKICQEKISF